MKLNKEIVETFIQDGSFLSCTYYPFLKSFHAPDPKRKEVVIELSAQLEALVEAFPTFNTALWTSLFPTMDKVLQKVTIVPVVGTSQHSVITSGEEILIFLDLHYIADITPIVSQMSYIMQNYLHLQLCQRCIRDDYPFTAQSYQELLAYDTFVHGLANFIAWNANAKQYKFYTEKYEPYKEKAFGMLASALEVENKALQHRILLESSKGEFWSQFPKVAGMFYFDDMYREYGVQGINVLYKRGWKHFVTHIFGS